MKKKRGNNKRRKLVLNNIKRNIIGLKSKKNNLSSEILRNVGFSKKRYSLASLSSGKVKKTLRSLIGNIF